MAQSSAFQPKYLYRFKPCVCESITVNYTPAGQPAFHTKSPDTDNLNAVEGMDISMRFLSLEYFLAGDFKNSNLAFDTKREINP